MFRRMSAVVDRAYHILLCHQKSCTHPRNQRVLPGSWFWTRIKAQRAADDIGFVGHCHYAFTAYGKVPVEISLSTLRNHQSACITVDITGAPFTAKNRRANKWAFKNVSKLQFPFRGYNSVGQIRAVVRNLYDEKDGGRGQYVAVKGDELKDFFVSCGLPVCEIRKEVLGEGPPSTLICKNCRSSTP
ncbi:hypothetical protein CEXT_343501 [Caerostris extrusa]|uniref:Uncharacterized protein n=1 Tax=Caerostris extrusa TaxID=172846 RepID=A0AAV4XSL7_CAEEX|nr:hypothetical protein CEXT_343501 [Caerostris extrusa]